MRTTAAALAPIFDVVFVVLQVILWLVFAWVILSWIVFFVSQSSFRWRNRGAYNVLIQINDILSRMAWPFLKPFRRLLRRWDTAGIDWSPMLLWLFILLLRALLEGLYRLILGPAVP